MKMRNVNEEKMKKIWGKWLYIGKSTQSSPLNSQ